MVGLPTPVDRWHRRSAWRCGVLAHKPAVAGVVPGLWALGGNQSGSGCVCVSYFKAAEVADIRRPQ